MIKRSKSGVSAVPWVMYVALWFAVGCGEEPPTEHSLFDAESIEEWDSRVAIELEDSHQDTLKTPLEMEPDGTRNGGQPETDGVADAGIEVDGEKEEIQEESDTSPDSKSFVRVFESTRFHLKQPARVYGLRAMVHVPPGDEREIEVILWDDFGGNFVDFVFEKPLAIARRTVTPDDDGQWLDFPFEMPIEVDPGRLVFAGMALDGPDLTETSGVPVAAETKKGATEWLAFHDGASNGFNDYGATWELPSDTVQLHVDSAPSQPDEDLPPTSLVWSPNDPKDAYGFKPLSSSADFLIEMEVEWIHTVEAFDFLPVDPEENGLPYASRPALEDVDGDGAIDVLVGGVGLFINQGDGTFIDDTPAWFGDDIPGNGHFGDFDNDGDPDLFLPGLEDRLLRNDGGVFVDVTAESGIDDQTEYLCNGVSGIQPLPTEAIAWVDMNGDGFLDLYAGNFICWDDGFGAPDGVWINNGNGTFTNQVEALNMLQPQQINPDKEKFLYLASRGIAPADVNGDGMLDIFVGNYRLHRNLLWMNDGVGGFENMGAQSMLEGVGVQEGFQTHYGHTIGAVWGDVDQDGDLDTFHANLAHPRFYHFSDRATLFINEGGKTPVFTDVGEEAGIRYQETPSNPNFLDYDNDGDLDLFFTCIYAGRPSQFYRNDGHPSWKEVSYPTGVEVLNGWGSATADLDGDGDVDLFTSTATYLNQNVSGNGSIWIRPKGSGAGATNRSGFGARVVATLNGVAVMRELSGAHGTSVQSSPFLHIGLGAEPSASVEVHFPLTNTVIALGDVAAGARLVVYEDGVVETF